MSDQSQTAANPPASEPVLCKMGCGFFGNNATSGCCSKCWTDMQKKKEGSGVAPRKESVQLKAIEEVEEVVPEVEEKQALMETEKVESATDKPVEAAPRKKKGKKKSYKDLMASMVVQSESSKDIEKEKEALRKVVGGGVFSKIDKI